MTVKTRNSTLKTRSRNWIHHGEDGDDLYVDDGVRVCMVCNKPRVLGQFRKNKSSGRVCMACHECAEGLRASNHKRTELGVAEKLVGALAKATNRRSAATDLFPMVGATLKVMSDTWGGEEATAKKLAELTTSAMEAGDPELGLKVVKMLLESMAKAQKMSPEPIDVRDLSPDDMKDILLEPARQLILEDASFRRDLLNMPDVRAAILGDEGVDVIDGGDCEYEDGSEMELIECQT